MTASPDTCSASLPGQPRNRYEIDCAGAQLHVHARSVATVLRVDGEVDASNADLVATTIRRFALLRAPLILDLTHLEFLSSAGLRMLLVLNEEQRSAGLHCTVVDGAPLRRLTRIIREHDLPVVDSLADALQRVADVPRARGAFGPARQEEPQRAG